MSQFYDGSGRMRDRRPNILRGLATTVVVAKMVALIAIVITLPVWGRLVPKKAG